MFSYGERRNSNDQHGGRWINPDEIRKGDVISSCGPASDGYSERYVDEVIGYVEPKYSAADYAYQVRTHNVAASHIRSTQTFVHFPSGNTSAYLVRRLTTEEDVERLERELSQARAALATERQAEEERHVDEAASLIRRTAGRFVPGEYAREAARALFRAGKLKD
jgi:hypothetical protein